MEHHNGPATLDSILEEYKIQPHIRWMKVYENDPPPHCDMYLLVLFDDGTVVVEISEDVDWLGAKAYAYISYSH